MNLGFYVLIFELLTSSRRSGRRHRGWGKYEFFVFLATTMFVNSLVQAFFMPNAEEFSELIRTGGLDFALLKPIDTQFLISLQQDELVVAGQLRRWPSCCWSTRCRGSKAGPSSLQVAALPALRRSAACRSCTA